MGVKGKRKLKGLIAWVKLGPPGVSCGTPAAVKQSKMFARLSMAKALAKAGARSAQVRVEVNIVMEDSSDQRERCRDRERTEDQKF